MWATPVHPSGALRVGHIAFFVVTWQRRETTDMPIDPLSKDLITIGQAAKLVVGRPHSHSVYRWSHYGLRGVLLETVKVNQKLYTTPDALRRFLLDTQEEKLGSPAKTPPKAKSSRKAKTTARTRAKLAAKRRLTRAGI